MRKKLKFALCDTIETIYQEIVKELPELKTSWEVKEGEDGKIKYFVTEANGVHIEVYEKRVVFKLINEDNQEDVREHKNIDNRGQVGKIKMYQILCNRFDKQEDFKFYRRILRLLRGHKISEKARNGIQFTEQTDLGEDS